MQKYYIEWLKHKPYRNKLEYFITCMFHENVKSINKIEKLTKTLSNRAKNFFARNYKKKGKSGICFFPFLEQCTDGKYHLHILFGGGYKNKESPKDTKQLFKKALSEISGFLNPNYYNPKRIELNGQWFTICNESGDEWFKEIYDISGAIEYVAKTMNKNPDALLINAVKIP